MAAVNLAEELRNAAVREGELAICWLGQAGFLLKDSQGRELALDPYLSNCGERMRGFKRLSAMLIGPKELSPRYYIATHTHFDHFDYDTVPVVVQNSPDTLFFGPGSCMAEFQKAGAAPRRCIRLDRGDRYRDEGVSIEAVWADHGTLSADAIGILLEMGGHRLYFSGDTAFHDCLFRKVAEFRPEVAFLSVNGQFGNMTGEEGARAAELCGSKYGVPCHIWTFMEHQGSPLAFCSALRESRTCVPRCFAQGEIQLLTRGGELIEREAYI